jgi:hypothetical protein
MAASPGLGGTSGDCPSSPRRPASHIDVIAAPPPPGARFEADHDLRTASTDAALIAEIAEVRATSVGREAGRARPDARRVGVDHLRASPARDLDLASE